MVGLIASGLVECADRVAVAGFGAGPRRAALGSQRPPPERLLAELYGGVEEASSKLRA